METDSACDLLEIPAYLHQGQRAPNQQFASDEKIYRRFPRTKDDKDFIMPDGSPSIAMFDTRKMSCVRERYVLDPSKDPLYNIKSKEHFFSFGVIEIKIDFNSGVSFNHPDIAGKTYTLKLIHSPEKCW